MATLKHLGSKNADYGAAEAYLTFEHDEFTMKPTLEDVYKRQLRAIGVQSGQSQEK